jgi:hypothetical protein
MTLQSQPGDKDGTGPLEKLAAELGRLGFQCRLVDPIPELAWLEVTNPRARVLSERIAAQAGWFWWPWAERLAETGDVVGAAARIAHVLRTVEPEASNAHRGIRAPPSA